MENSIKVTIRTPTSERMDFQSDFFVAYIPISFHTEESIRDLHRSMITSFRSTSSIQDLLHTSLTSDGLKRNPKICSLITPEKNLNKSVLCSICCETILDELISPLKCHHIFHTSCLEEWVKYKAKCPVCRKDIPVSEL